MGEEGVGLDQVSLPDPVQAELTLLLLQVEELKKQVETLAQSKEK